MNYLLIDKMIKEALIEDIPNEDISTTSIIGVDLKCEADLICKEDGILAGLPIFKRVFDILGEVEVISLKNDGDKIKKYDKIALLRGSTRNILSGERVALNYLQRMSGIATKTNKFVDKLKDSNTKLLDTRKTIPNLRILDKYSVKIGGGINHRFNLSDGIMIKDNHIEAAGGIKKAVELLRENTSFVRKIEVEVENLDMVKEAVEVGVDIIMLDNMDIDTAREALKIIDRKALVEFSGNVTLERMEEISKIGVDYISVGELTHSVKALDLSLKNLRNI
ncbi:carboxylating nicotinate-nucleotide diphosphorylase [Romboutsia sp. 1001713B170207_170306_H8]|uniref:carboxylating nicotinate-nucleotide diphosphorylase n=1 Tax=Romboutsia sp. 1001713B170207_170306_H8 TaxID=2787112 RepID=UPI001896EAC8|nr:carboxylating nicotinate-nucleotide diphosphorylase [Romboutsia sp. 1001713B170207_170306_H8]